MKKNGILIILVLVLLLSACNLPADEGAGELDPTSAAIVEMTVAAAQQAAASGGDESSGEQQGSADETEPAAAEETTQAVTPTATEEPEDDDDDEDEGEHGTDQARFVSDVTINDYTTVSPGDEITKTWRLQNVGTATWTTEYALVFDDEDQMGAPDRVPFPVEVPPDGYLNISVEFTAPDESGEYSSYWLLENEDGEQFGTGEEFDQPIWMIILVEGDDVETGTSSEGIEGGATITDAAVTVDQVNYSGSCPATITFTYTVTTSSAGAVNVGLVFTTISPSGWVFDDPGTYTPTVGGATTLTYSYTFIPGSSVTANVRVRAIGSSTFVSSPLQFSIECN